MERTTQQPEDGRPSGNSFSLKKGLLHAFLALIAVFIVGGVLVAVLPIKDPEKFGEGLGRFSVFIMLIAFGISWLFQTGRKRFAWGAILVLLLGMSALVLAVYRAVEGRQFLELSPEEQKAPVFLDDDRTRLHHPAIGFTIKLPSANFQANQGMLAVGDLGRIPGFEKGTWMYTENLGVRFLIVGAAKQTTVTQVQAEAIFSGILKGMRNRAPEEQASIEIIEERPHWESAKPHATGHYLINKLGHIRSAVWIHDGSDSESVFLLVILAISLEVDAFAPVWPPLTFETL